MLLSITYVFLSMFQKLSLDESKVGDMSRKPSDTDRQSLSTPFSDSTVTPATYANSNIAIFEVTGAGGSLLRTVQGVLRLV